MFRLARVPLLRHPAVLVRYAGTATVAPTPAPLANPAEPQTSRSSGLSLNSKAQLTFCLLWPAGAEKMMRRFWKTVAVERKQDGGPRLTW